MKKQQVKYYGSVKRQSEIPSHDIIGKRVDKQLLGDFGINTQEPMKMYCDNQSARQITSNLMFHEDIKHIKVDCHFVQEIRTIHSKQRSIGDILIKGLEPKSIEINLNKLGLVDIYNPNLRECRELNLSNNYFCIFRP
jgi:hypothetical protein